jgi:hypothetical protein
VVVVATARDSARIPLDDAGLHAMILDRLSDEDASEVLDAVAPGLAPANRPQIPTRTAAMPIRPRIGGIRLHC